MAKLSDLTLAEKKSLYKQAKDAYYNSADGKPIMSDAQFDKLEAAIREEAPNWVGLKATGIKVGAKKAAKLAVPCPSLDKLKSEAPAKVEAWLRKICVVSDHIVVMDKLDGSSLQGVYTQSAAHKNVYDLTRLMTRGDGVTGKDISYFIPHLNVVKRIDLRPTRPVEFKTLVVRFEAVFPFAVFQRKWSKDFDSARAAASAIFNRQDVHPAVADVHLVALKVQAPVYGIKAGLDFLEREGFEVVKHKQLRAEGVTPDKLEAMCLGRKAVSKYELDGLVMVTGSMRPYHIADTEDKPDYAKAFKVNSEEDAPTTTIVNIEWNASKHGILVPRAELAPVKFGNVTVRFASMHNAKWMQEMGCGVGAEVQIIRSGDIIPKVIGVSKPAKLKLPSQREFGEYAWDGPHLVLLDDNDDVYAKRIAAFFNALELEDVAGGLAEKLIKAGVRDTAQLPLLTAADFLKLPGVKANAAKFGDQMKRVRLGEFDTVKLMVASGVFGKGVGSTRLYTLARAKPELFDGSTLTPVKRPAFVAEVAAVKGCGPAFAELFADGYIIFRSWMRQAKLKWKAPVDATTVDGPLNGKSFSWTGYRSNDEEERIKALGGEVVAFSTRKTTHLFVTDGGKASSKGEKAASAGIAVVKFSEFIKKVKV